MDRSTRGIDRCTAHGLRLVLDDVAGGALATVVNPKANLGFTSPRWDVAFGRDRPADTVTTDA